MGCIPPQKEEVFLGRRPKQTIDGWGLGRGLHVFFLKSNYQCLLPETSRNAMKHIIH